MVAWGLVMTLMCLCNTYEGLIMCVSSSRAAASHLFSPSARVFLGLTEAGLFPGVRLFR
jgi:hypothetical protein